MPKKIFEGNGHDGPRTLRLPQVKDTTGLCKSEIYRLIKDGQFPRQFKISLQAVGWLETEVRAWLEAKIDASRRKHAVRS
jgi:prophage regulatory protein